MQQNLEKNTKYYFPFLFNLIDIDYSMYFCVINNGPFILKIGFCKPQLNWCIISEKYEISLSLLSLGGFAQSELMSGHLIDFFVPFLPLEHRHVKLCARDAFAIRGMEPDETTLDEVAKAMLYVPKEEKLFSAQGCKSIPQRINFFLH